MFDHVHLGWLDSDDYRVAAEAAGVVELPGVPPPGDPADGPADEPAGDPAAEDEPGTEVR